MKKKSIINMIRCHVEKNDAGFRTEAYDIAKDFEMAGDTQLSAYIMSLLSNAETLVPQIVESESPFLEKISTHTDMLLLPDSITKDILGIVQAVKHRIGINKFLFQGAPGTGKTEAVKHLARILNREIFLVDVAALVDSKLGQTQKNIAQLFKELSNFVQPEKVLILFDELDSIALDRTNSNDLREMGRATTAFFRGLDGIPENLVLVATTNLFQYFDKALVRRFDFVVDFNRYVESDLLAIAEKMLNRYLAKANLGGRDVRLFRKILRLKHPIQCPGDIQNLIKTSVAFSNPDDEFDYLRRLYSAVIGGASLDVKDLQKSGFTVREIGILMQKSKSGVARELQEKI